MCVGFGVVWKVDVGKEFDLGKITALFSAAPQKIEFVIWMAPNAGCFGETNIWAHWRPP